MDEEIRKKLLDIGFVTIIIVLVVLCIRFYLFYDTCEDCAREGLCNNLIVWYDMDGNMRYVYTNHWKDSVIENFT